MRSQTPVIEKALEREQSVIAYSSIQESCYPPIMRAIAATDYDGCVGQEFTPKGEPIAGLERAFKVCDV